MMFPIYDRVSKWNAQRYDRKYDSKLAISLLREEYEEWLHAEEEVDKLDALCDTVFVAMGVLWKVNITHEELEEFAQKAIGVLSSYNMEEPNPAYMIATHLDIFEYEPEFLIEDSMMMIIYSAMGQMLSMRLSFEQCGEAIMVVCDSNDSKKVEKVAADIKANLDKGEGFIPPEPRLQEILDGRR